MKQTIRLTENELHNIIKESVNNILSELDWRTAENAADVADKKANSNKINDYDKLKYERQKHKFRNYAQKRYNTQYGFPEDFDNNWKRNNEKAYRIKHDDEWIIDPETNKAKSRYHNSYVIDIPQEFHPTNGQLKQLSKRQHDIEDFYGNKSEYRSGKWRPKNVIEPDESDYLERLAQNHTRKKQPSQINKIWQDVLDYDYNTNNINI